jgi:hypothetical protein
VFCCQKHLAFIEKIECGAKFPSFSYFNYPSVDGRNYGIQDSSYKALVPQTIRCFYIQVINKYTKKIRHVDTSRLNLQLTYRCLTTLITIHQVTLAPRNTCIAVKNCSKCNVCSSRSYIKLSTPLNANLPCVPFLFTISGAGNNTSVKT